MTAARRYHSTDPRQLLLLSSVSGDWVSAAPENDVVPRARAAPRPRVALAVAEWTEPGPSRQLGLFDRPAERPCVVGQSYGVCQILRATGGDPTSGAQRAKQTKEIDTLLRRLFDDMTEQHGEEFAVMRLFEIMAGARGYRHEDWQLELWVEYREELLIEFAGSGHEAVLPSHDVYDEADEDA